MSNQETSFKELSKFLNVSNNFKPESIKQEYSNKWKNNLTDNQKSVMQNFKNHNSKELNSFQSLNLNL